MCSHSVQASIHFYPKPSIIHPRQPKCISRVFIYLVFQCFFSGFASFFVVFHGFGCGIDTVATANRWVAAAPPTIYDECRQPGLENLCALSCRYTTHSLIRAPTSHTWIFRFIGTGIQYSSHCRNEPSRKIIDHHAKCIAQGSIFIATYFQEPKSRIHSMLRSHNMQVKLSRDKLQ